MDLTPNYGLGKPLPGENYDIAVANANMDILDLAIDGINDRTAVVEALFTAPVVKITTLFTVAPNFTIAVQDVYVWGPWVYGNLQVVRTTSTLPSSANGNITNTAAALWNPSYPNLAKFKPVGATEAAWNGGSSGPLFSGYIGATNVAVSSLPPGTPGGDINIGESLSGSFAYIRNL